MPFIEIDDFILPEHYCKRKHQHERVILKEVIENQKKR